jgi:dimethylamine--corrinoid protein Co-methyltransferase
MGDGARVELPAEPVKEDILAGTLDAADRVKIPELNPDEVEQLFEIFTDTNRIVAVKADEEVIQATTISVTYGMQPNLG